MATANTSAAWRNIFPLAHPILDERKLRADAHRLQSSQAFCWSVWGTALVPKGAAVLDVICDLLADEAVTHALRSHPTFSFEEDDSSVLNEFGGGRSTLDLCLGSPDLVVSVESKLREALDCCSQVKGQKKNCSGVLGPGSDLKESTQGQVANCRLEKQDGKRSPRAYWTVLRQLAKPGAFPVGHSCPFTDGRYQAMRNITFAAQSGAKSGRDWRTVFAYPPSAETNQVASDMTRRLLPENCRRVLRLDYSVLAARLEASRDSVCRALSEYMAPRLMLARGRR